MSKRIKIIFDSNRPNLSKLFHSYLLHKYESSKHSSYSDDEDEYARYWDSVFPGWDDDSSYDSYDEDGIFIFPSHSHRSKHINKGKKKKYNYDDDFNDVEVIDGSDSSSKVIFFYYDYHYKDERLEFNSLKDFNDFCLGMGYEVPKYVSDDLAYRSESHCCLNPLSVSKGDLEIMSEDSYGNLFYEACDVSELSGY